MHLRTYALCLAVLGTSAWARSAANGQVDSSSTSSVNAAGQSASGQASSATSGSVNSAGRSASAAKASQQTVEAELTKSIDAGKVKQGDAVEAKTTKELKGAGAVEIPKGSKLIGHVTEVKPHSKASQGSTLGIMFDQAVLKGGQTVPFHAMIQAVSVPQTSMPANMDMGMDAGAGATMPSGGQGRRQGPLGGVGNTVGGVANGAGNTVGGVASTTGSAVNGVGDAAGTAVGANAAGTLNANASGVSGLADVQLNSSAGANGSVLSSNSKNVKLNSGTHLMLQVMQP